MNTPKVFETDRLLIRPYTLDDVRDAYEMNRDPRVQKYILDEGPMTLENMHIIIRDHVLGDYSKHGFGRMAVVHKADDRYIGFTGLKYLPEFDKVDIGYRLDVDYWGRGLATESCRPMIRYGFEELGLSEIIALAFSENKASVRVMEKLNMKYKCNMLYEGVDVVYFELTEEYWRSCEL